MQSFREIQTKKGQPTLGAVHIASASGDGKKPKKATDFATTLNNFRMRPAEKNHHPAPGDFVRVDSDTGNVDAAPLEQHVLEAHGFRVRLSNYEDRWYQLDPKNLIDVKAKDGGRAWHFAKAASEKARALRPMDGTDGKLAHTPFPHDPNVLGQLRHDQVPRFFGALTDGTKLPTKEFDHKDLIAMQDRVDPAKVQSMMEQKPGKKPVVVTVGGRNYIADGHHRASADYLSGKDKTTAHYLDLDPKTDTVKRIPITVTKADPNERMVFGFASVAERDGVLVIDKQEDMIPVATLEKAVYDFMLFSREGDDMHVGHPKSRCIESMMFTTEKCKALNIDLPKDDQGRPMQAWWTGFYVEDDGLWAAYKRGERPEFSIGGAAVPVKI